MKTPFIQFFLLFLIESNAFAGIFGHNNYDECILENMKGTQTEQAALLVANSCASKFKKNENLTSKEYKTCNGNKYEVSDKASVQFPVPNEFGTLKLIRFGWEERYVGSPKDTYKVYIQHSYPFHVAALYFGGYNSQNSKKSDIKYYCTGNAMANAVGVFICQNVRELSKFYRVEEVVTSEVNLIELHEKIGKKCN